MQRLIFGSLFRFFKANNSKHLYSFIPKSSTSFKDNNPFLFFKKSKLNSTIQINLISKYSIFTVKSNRMDPTLIEVAVKEKIELNDREKELFAFFLDFVNAKDVKVVMRSAGGWVRDKLICKECHDIDITLDTMTGEQFMNALIEYLREKGTDHLITGHGVIKSNPDKSKHLETVTLKLFGYDIDITNLRSEEYASTSRIPTMKFGTPLQDAERRDLTINSMLYNINTGEVEDFTGKGMSDLKNGIIRTPLEPYQTFIDDPLRVLRAFRFATRFNFSIDPPILDAIQNPEIRVALEKKVSRERVRTELQKMLVDPNAAKGLTLIFETGLWPIVFQMTEKCIELQDPSFYLKRQAESHFLAQKCIQRIDQVAELPILKSEYSLEDIQLLLLMSAVSFPFATLSFKSGKQLVSLPYYLVLESLKFPDKGLKVCTIISTVCETALKFQSLVKLDLTKEFNNLAILIRKQGNTWELAIFVAMISDLVNTTNEEETVQSYKRLNQFIFDNQISAVYNLKPLIDGKEIMGLFKLDKQGPVISRINNNIFLWQARNINLGKKELIENIAANEHSFTI